MPVKTPTPSDFEFLASDFWLLKPDLCIAVSGGADSMALLHMVVGQRVPDQKLIAVTVDHGLRAQSAQEAEDVGAYCRTVDVDHHILRWEGEKPANSLQNSARNARRQLLLDFCKRHAIGDLMLAHQADDQAETFLQRLARGAGPGALAGMKPRMIQQGITLHRPLLHMRRAALRAYCMQHAIPFTDDPSNDDPRFERVRWRQALAQLENVQPGFVTGLLRSQQRLYWADAAVAQQAEGWLAYYAETDGAKTTLPRKALAQQPFAVIVMILRSLMTSEKSYQVDQERLESWVSQAFRVTPTETALTLGGWWVQIKKEQLVLQPAPARGQRSGF